MIVSNPSPFSIIIITRTQLCTLSTVQNEFASSHTDVKLNHTHSKNKHTPACLLQHIWYVHATCNAEIKESIIIMGLVFYKITIQHTYKHI